MPGLHQATVLERRNWYEIGMRMVSGTFSFDAEERAVFFAGGVSLARPLSADSFTFVTPTADDDTG